MRIKICMVPAVLCACLAMWCVPAFGYEQVEDIVSYGHGSNDAQYLVIHETANPGASAWNHVVYWSSDDTYAVHYVMELDGSVVYQTMPDWALAWHVGSGNYSTVGIELAHATDYASFNAQWSEAVAWAGDYLSSRGWGVDRLLSHDECRWMWGGTDHTDPTGYFSEYGRSWEEFESAVEDYMDSGSVPPAYGGTSTSGSEQVGFGGTYECNVDSLNVRDGVWGNVVAQYGYGQTVDLDDWFSIDSGIVWGRYTSWSGFERYVAVGPYTGSEDAGDYLVRYGSQPQESESFSCGCYSVVADSLNVRDGAWGNVVAQYGYGQTVYIDRVETAWDGSSWGVYTSWSGFERYVSMDWIVRVQ